LTYAPGFSFLRIGKIRREYGIDKNGMFEESSSVKDRKVRV
jgi:hypothetical protein